MISVSVHVPESRFRSSDSISRRRHVFPDRFATITLCDVPMDGIRRSDCLSDHPLHFKRLRLKESASLDVQCNRIFPDTQSLIPPIPVLPFHHSNTPSLLHSSSPLRLVGRSSMANPMATREIKRSSEHDQRHARRENDQPRPLPASFPDLGGFKMMMAPGDFDRFRIIQLCLHRGG